MTYWTCFKSHLARDILWGKYLRCDHHASYNILHHPISVIWKKLTSKLQTSLLRMSDSSSQESQQLRLHDWWWDRWFPKSRALREARSFAGATRAWWWWTPSWHSSTRERHLRTMCLPCCIERLQRWESMYLSSTVSSCFRLFRDVSYDTSSTRPRKWPTGGRFIDNYQWLNDWINDWHGSMALNGWMDHWKNR